MVCDRLLRLIFEEKGVEYKMSNSSKHEIAENKKNFDKNSIQSIYQHKKHAHNIRSCTFGKLCVDWKYAFMHKGFI